MGPEPNRLARPRSAGPEDNPDRSNHLRSAAVSACAEWLRCQGGRTGDRMAVTLRILGPESLAVRYEGPLPGPAEESVLPAIPPAWQRILDILAGADRPLPAVDIERRYRRSFEGDRATPEVALRLHDMTQIGLVERRGGGYRLPGAPAASVGEEPG